MLLLSNIALYIFSIMKMKFKVRYLIYDKNPQTIMSNTLKLVFVYIRLASTTKHYVLRETNKSYTIKTSQRDQYKEYLNHVDCVR